MRFDAWAGNSDCDELMKFNDEWLADCLPHAMSVRTQNYSELPLPGLRDFLVLGNADCAKASQPMIGPKSLCKGSHTITKGLPPSERHSQLIHDLGDRIRIKTQKSNSNKLVKLTVKRKLTNKDLTKHLKTDWAPPLASLASGESDVIWDWTDI